MLDERKSAILKTVVTEYIETAQPVGSAHVVRDSGIDVSPATVRADMAALEREGYLSHPHTSAGRIPTDKGYRFFVDRFCEDEQLGQTEQHQVRDFFARAHGELERMLRDTSVLLAELTNYAAVVVAPDTDALTVRSAQVVRLAPKTALVVIVLSNGAIEKRAVELDESDSDAAVEHAGRRLGTLLSGHPLSRTITAPAPSGDTAVDRILSSCTTTLAGMPGREPEPDHVFVGGASRMAHAFDAVDTVRSVLAVLEESYVVVSLLHDALALERNVAIGGEIGVGPLAECSVVVAPYAVGDDVLGTIGVLGPTRMNYGQALAAVAVVGQRLSSQLSAGNI
ncbi:MAG TPA: heat-inducible transcriptional repressor HrcA [Acidimicrobiales bacterium]|nr:heat-inducible transcriptional repressor HrcA [Acidimicrobiales bacterium]